MNMVGELRADRQWTTAVDLFVSANVISNSTSDRGHYYYANVRHDTAAEWPFRRMWGEREKERLKQPKC